MGEVREDFWRIVRQLRNPGDRCRVNIKYMGLTSDVWRAFGSRSRLTTRLWLNDQIGFKLDPKVWNMVEIRWQDGDPREPVHYEYLSAQQWNDREFPREFGAWLQRF